MKVKQFVSRPFLSESQKIQRAKFKISELLVIDANAKD